MLPEEDDKTIKPEDIADGEINAIVAITQEESEVDEIELEKVDFATTGYYMSFIYSMIPDIDTKLMSASEQAKIEKMKTQLLKLMCHSVNELHKEYFPKKTK